MYHNNLALITLVEMSKNIRGTVEYRVTNVFPNTTSLIVEAGNFVMELKIEVRRFFDTTWSHDSRF